MTRLLVFLIRGYQILVGPILCLLNGGTTGCRFEPSCSEYARQALLTHGALRGGWLALKRLARCHPWGGCGHDPVPAVTSTASAL